MDVGLAIVAIVAIVIAVLATLPDGEHRDARRRNQK